MWLCIPMSAAGLERCASEYVNKMLDIVESDDPEEGEMLLIMSVFPSFSDIFEQIRRSDSEYAKHSMGHFIQYMKGPKNRPTDDHSGLLPVIWASSRTSPRASKARAPLGFETAASCRPRLHHPPLPGPLQSSSPMKFLVVLKSCVSRVVVGWQVASSRNSVG